MGSQHKIYFLFLFLFLNGCVTTFIPEINEDINSLVVEGLITDQPGPYTVKLSTSLPLSSREAAKPLNGCTVSVTDDMGHDFGFYEADNGKYITDPGFQGIIGRTYTLHVKTNNSFHNLSYQSSPVFLGSVPQLDTLYYIKEVLQNNPDGSPNSEGCQIYLGTHDPLNRCKFFRWEFTETWDFHLPYYVANSHCWISENSDMINIKNTSAMGEARIERFPIKFISNESDRLREKYSIIVYQYSLNEEEYNYWEKLQKTVEETGSLYDVIPAAIPSNIECVENPSEKVLGYFSVSAVKTKRIFIKEFFRGIINPYKDCENLIVSPTAPIPGLNVTVWLIIDNSFSIPAFKVLTYFRGCADCTVRGTTGEPYFWNDDKQ